jgi:hypothetical protein
MRIFQGNIYILDGEFVGSMANAANAMGRKSDDDGD